MAALLAIALISFRFQILSVVGDTAFVEKTIFGSFERATRIALSPQGWIYVVDQGSNTLRVYKELGGSQKSVGGYGWTSFSLDDPTGVATDGLNVYVADRGNHRIQRFDRNLNFVSSLSTRDTAEVAARFGYPLGVALSRQGDLFVLDGENIRVLKFNSQSVFDRSFGSIDAENRKLRQPVKILVGPNDHVYVLERERLMEFDYFGNYVRAIGSLQLNGARGFTLTSEGTVVATADTIFWFGADGSLRRLQPASHLLGGETISRIEDVAVRDNQLLILTATKMFVFSMIF